MSRSDDRQAVLDQALYLAVSTGEVQKMRQFLAEGGNPNAPIDAGRSAFGVALWLNMLDVAHEMLTFGGDVNAQRDQGKSPPLWMTAIYRDAHYNTTARTEFCIKNGADFSLTFDYAGRQVNVLDMMDEYKKILTRNERAALVKLRCIIERELALRTRLRHGQIAGKRNTDGRRFKL